MLDERLQKHVPLPSVPLAHAPSHTHPHTQHKLHELHQHIQSTRERTLKLLAEKEAEIQQLRSEIVEVAGAPYPRRETGGGGGGGGGALERSVSHSSVSSQQEAPSENNSELRV